MKTLCSLLCLLFIAAVVHAAEAPVRVLVWSEGTEPASVYPDGIRGAIAEGFKGRTDIVAKTATLSDPDQGLSEDALKNADVLIWWGHQKHGDVKDEAVNRIIARIKQDGMGMIALHSAHWSKPLDRLLNSPGNLGSWRNDGKTERIWITAPQHPIAAGLPKEGFSLEKEEMYGEPFLIAKPDEVIFLSTFAGGNEAFRSGMVWEVGPKKGRVFYFRPGHEEYPTYFNETIRKVIANAILWCSKRT